MGINEAAELAQRLRTDAEYIEKRDAGRKRFQEARDMDEATKRPTTLTLQPCNCGAPTCKRTGFREGTFYQGSGFERELAEEVKRRYDAHDVPEWQLISAAPKDGSWQVIARIDGDIILWWYKARFSERLGYWVAPSGGLSPTHWLPLPPAPQPEGSAEEK